MEKKKKREKEILQILINFWYLGELSISKHDSIRGTMSFQKNAKGAQSLGQRLINPGLNLENEIKLVFCFFFSQNKIL